MQIDDGSPANDREPINFGEFCLDRRAGRLTRRGETIQLRPKTWAVLVYLAERPGVLVGKEALLDAVWPDVAVTPDTLTKSIGELRVALGDDSRTPRCIETVHRRGFRFVARTGAAAQREVPPLEWRPAEGTARPFVGRAAELQQLGELFARAAAGERQMAFVTGPAGVGKTALVDAFLDAPALRAAARPVWIGRGSCVDQHGIREAYMPVLEALERLARGPEAARLTRLLLRAAPTWLAQMPWVVSARTGSAGRLPQVARPERMLREFAALTEAVSAEHTLVLVLEDLHWSDPSTVDLLAVLAQRREPAGLLVIGTYRPAEVAVHDHVLSQVVRTLQLRRQCTDIPVHELFEADVRRYLELRFPRGDLASTLAPLLHDYTEGNPLFMVAVVEHLLSRGWILETAPGWALSTSPEKLQLEVPDDARCLIAVQLDSLSPLDRTLLEAASVAGREFVAPVVAAALGWAVEDAEARCEALARQRRFLRVTHNGEWPDPSVVRGYTFTHELYRETVHAGISAAERRRLHRGVGEALEAAYGSRAAEIAAELAVHFERGGEPARRLHYLATAAARARRRFANREAFGHLQAAIALAARLPDSGDGQRRELELRLALAPVLNDLYGFASEPLRENCERAAALCDAVGSPEQRFDVLYAQCHVHSVRADRVRLPQLSAELDGLATRLGTAQHRLLADSVLIRTAVHAGRFVEACRLAEGRLFDCASAPGPYMPPAYGADPAIASNSHYAYALWCLGHAGRARLAMKGSLGMAGDSASPFTRAAALGLAGMLDLLCREPAEVRERAERLAALAAEHGFRFWSAYAAALAGWVRVQVGDTDAGITELERARTALETTGARLFSTHILAFLAEAQLRNGAVAEGLAAVDEGLAVAKESLDRSHWPELWRLRGELLLAAAPPQLRRRRARPASPPATEAHWGEAERCLQRALELAREWEAKSLELRAATSLARAWHARKRTPEARALLGSVCEWFGVGADTADLADARTLLTQLSIAA